MIHRINNLRVAIGTLEQGVQEHRQTTSLGNDVQWVIAITVGNIQSCAIFQKGIQVFKLTEKPITSRLLARSVQQSLATTIYRLVDIKPVPQEPG